MRLDFTSEILLIHLGKLRAFSASLCVEQPVSVLKKARKDCCKLLLETTEDGPGQEEEVTASL